jgi:hypothetical protein
VIILYNKKHKYRKGNKNYRKGKLLKQCWKVIVFIAILAMERLDIPGGTRLTLKNFLEWGMKF